MQGREKDVILLSFVRANRSKRVGFLDNYPRSNVALSRAKKALTIIGNIDTLSMCGIRGVRCISQYLDYCLFGVNGAELWMVAEEGLEFRL